MITVGTVLVNLHTDILQPCEWAAMFNSLKVAQFIIFIYICWNFDMWSQTSLPPKAERKTRDTPYAGICIMSMIFLCVIFHFWFCYISIYKGFGWFIYPWLSGLLRWLPLWYLTLPPPPPPPPPPLNKMADISQTTFSSTLSWMEMLEFRLKFHCDLFLKVQSL